MQNNNRKNSKAKGYYILLTALVLAAGVSGYIFLSDASQEQEEVKASLSVPVEQPENALPGGAAQQKPGEESPVGESVAAAGTVEQSVMPVSGSVLQNYAMDKLSFNTTTRDWRVHGGVDLAAQMNEDVKAARSGTVLSVYEDDFYGMTVVLQHADGFTTSYCGLAAEPLPEAGQTVKAGQVIGQIGGTAMIESALDSHLHFEVCKNGEPMDPAAFLYN